MDERGIQAVASRQDRKMSERSAVDLSMPARGTHPHNL